MSRVPANPMSRKLSRKISVLRDENVPQAQGITSALNMERSGRVNPANYIRASKKSMKRASFRS